MPVPVPREWYRIDNAAAKVADVYILDEISPYGITASDFIHDLSTVTAPTINLHLNTPGGDVFDGIAIFNALKGHHATVNAFVPGIAASIGTVIAMAADHIAIAPHARMMIHEAWGLSMGNASDMAKMAERLEATSDIIASIYAERAGQDVAYWRDLMRAETWYTDQQAVDAGLADEVARAGESGALKQAAAFDLSSFRHGERIAAMLRDEAEPDPPPAVQHACLCGGGDDCPMTAKASEVQNGSEQVPSERNELTHRETRRRAVDAAIEAAEVALGGRKA